MNVVILYESIISSRGKPRARWTETTSGLLQRFLPGLPGRLKQTNYATDNQRKRYRKTLKVTQERNRRALRASLCFKFKWLTQFGQFVTEYGICHLPKAAAHKLKLGKWKYTDERFWLTDKIWHFHSFHGNMNDWIQLRAELFKAGLR